MKLQTCSCNITKNELFLVIHRIFQGFRLLFRNTQLKEHLCMVASENITQTKAKIKKNVCFPLFPLSHNDTLLFSIRFCMKKCCDCSWKKRATSNLHFLIFIRNINKSTNQTKRHIQNTAIYLRRKFLTSAVNHFEKELHLNDYLAWDTI